MHDDTHELDRAARLIADADKLFITAGAGMGVDSGLPDFRGRAGLWRAYPALAASNLDFAAIASPGAFRRHPRLAWGFYGHRLQRYRDTRPHAGFAILARWAAHRDAFVFTSNVDGQFEAAGFAADRLCACHGSIHLLQCMDDCRGALWPADTLVPDIDEAACLWRGDLPSCPHCDGLARPNILMFGDDGWQSSRTDAQLNRLRYWLARPGRTVVIELGAGLAVPTVRHVGESTGYPLIRINAEDTDVRGSRDVALAMRALPCLQALDTRIGQA